MEEGQKPQSVDKPRQLSIPRKPVGGGGHRMASSNSASRRPSLGRQESYPYVPYSSPVEVPTVSAPVQFTYVPYRRSSLGRRSTNGGRRSRVSVSSGSSNGGAFSNDAVSPISPTSLYSRPSVDDLVGTVSREVSQMKSSAGSRRIPLSPLMELSSQEAVFRKDSRVSQPAQPLVRSQSSTVASIYQASRQVMGARSSIFMEARHNWLPVALRWPFMLWLFLASLALAALTLGLTIRSQRNQGLGMVQGSGIFLFGWRFTPTILAVIYTLLTTAMVNDIKRTEPYAKLSRPDGASAESSLFLKFRAIWFQPIDALRKSKNDGFRNWALFFALMINIFGLLIILPFSAALFSPRDVSLSRNTSFSKLMPSVSNALELTSDDSVLFRTISGVLLNTSTSPWVGNDYTILPFWPSSMSTLPLGAVLSESQQEWTANTTVYQAGLKCTPMKLRNFANVSLTKRIPSTSNIAVYGIVNLTSFVLESSDGCTLGLTGYPPEYSSNTVFKSGGGWWSGSPGFGYPALWAPGNGTVAGLDESHPIVLNSSTQCGDRSIFFFATPYKQNETFQAQGQVCKSTYYSANLPVTISTFGSQSTVKFDTIRFNITKSSLDSTDIDTTNFEKAFLSQDWSSRLQAPNSSSNPLSPIRPRFGGPLILLGAQNNFDVQAMTANPNLADQARQIKQRFFGESMIATFSKLSNQSTSSIEGRVSFGQRRIVVSFPVGLLLTAVFLLASLKIGVVTGYTRLHERPLNLSQDPSSTSAMASLVSAGQNTRALFEGLDTTSQTRMRKQLAQNVFYMRHGVLYSYDIRDTYQYSDTSLPSAAAYNEANMKDWRPRTLRWWLLGPLLVSVSAMIITIAILFAHFQDSGISHSRVDPHFNLNRGDINVITFAPYSVIPTLAAVGIKIWWDSMDQKLRRLQPYVSMSQQHTQISKGPSLSYVSTPIVLLVGKAARNRHFLLALVAFGAVLSEIFVISMSGLWDRNHGYHSHNVTLTRFMDLRTVPAIFTIPSSPTTPGATNLESNVRGMLSTVYGRLSTDWLYGATLETAYNSGNISWASDDWAFAPLNISVVQNSSDLRTDLSIVAVDSPSLRGRLECLPIDMSNISSWLTALDFTDKSKWNDTQIPADLEVGYELNIGLSMNQSTGNGSYKYWDADNPYFSFFATDLNMQCCGNETNNTPGKVSIGYWSSAADAAHSSVVVKWITGRPFGTQFRSSTNQLHWVWKEVPQITALKCNPIYETANARVKVDIHSGIVQDYDIMDAPLPDPSAWSHKYQDLNVSTDVPYTSTPSGSGFQVTPGKLVHNVSVSYGYLFNDILLSAANSARVGSSETDKNVTENLTDRTYAFRLPGLNVDVMSYSALALTRNNNSALLDPKILASVSSAVFSTFFKHFVQAPVSSNNAFYMKGAWGLQPQNEALPLDLGPIIAPRSQMYLQSSYQPSKTTRTTEGVVFTVVEQLSFNLTAVIMSLSILGFLLVTTLVVVWSHTKYLSKLPRDVDTLGSVLGFVYGSERLLRIASEEEVSLDEKQQTEGMVKMGWFNASGKRRWGIEIMDQRDDALHVMSGAVETEREVSMDLPIHGLRETSIDEMHGAGNESPIRRAPSSTTTTRWY